MSVTTVMQTVKTIKTVDSEMEEKGRLGIGTQLI